MENITSIPYCNSSKQLANAEDIQMSLLWEGRGWHPDACGCGNKTTCSQYLYETSCDTYARHDRCARYEVLLLFFKCFYNSVHYIFNCDDK